MSQHIGYAINRSRILLSNVHFSFSLCYNDYRQKLTKYFINSNKTQ